MTDAEFDRASRSLQIKIGIARAKSRRRNIPLADKLKCLERFRELLEELRTLRVNQFADGA